MLTQLARARLAIGDPVGAVAAAGDAVAATHRMGARLVECLALLTKTQVVRPSHGADAARADLDAALALVRETRALTYEPFIREELGRLNGDESELREAVTLYQAIAAPGPGVSSVRE